MSGMSVDLTTNDGQLVGVGRASGRVEVWHTFPTADTETRLNVT